MKVVSCKNGHFYDSETYDTCPYCGPAEEKRESAAVLSVPLPEEKKDKPVPVTPRGMYEGKDPYVFISYSHKDQRAIKKILNFFNNSNMRYWYDNGLHSGDDWNRVIAVHLENAAVCLLLLSENSAASNYVNNELIFAMNHRIPIHPLLLEEFDIPSEVEMLVGRIQTIMMDENYEEELLRALPPELIYSQGSCQGSSSRQYEHPLFAEEKKILDRQGTETYTGSHRTLKYPVLIQKDVIRNTDEKKLRQTAVTVCSLDHPLFIKPMDIVFENDHMYTYLEYHKVTFLDDFLKNRKPDEKMIEKWINCIIDGLDYLVSKGYAFNELARGSLVVTDDQDLKITRLHNAYYGVFRMKMDNRQYYTETMIHETAALLYQLCTGEMPVLPIRMITESHVSSPFLKKANLIIQKAARQQGKVSYTSFEQIREDMQSSKISLKDSIFLKEREKKLDQYLKAKKENRERFTAPSGETDNSHIRTTSLEEQFGFDATVFLADEPDSAEDIENPVKLLIVSTGQLLSFSKDKVIIGRDRNCEVYFTQVSLSRRHAEVRRNSDGTYTVTDLNSTGGTFINDIRIAGQSDPVEPGTIIRLANIELKLLP